VRTVPVVALGGQYVFAQNLEDVAEFVGLHGTGHTPLPTEVLIDRWVKVLRATQRLIRQMPEARLGERVIDNRDRSIRLMGHHVFRIAEAFLETAVDGIEYSAQLANEPPKPGQCVTGEEIAAYGEGIVNRLHAWWERLEDKACRGKVQTFFGPQPVAMLFERSTWHCAQHARQLAAVLERFGIEPDRPLSREDLAGLPLPEGLWE
jgi:hypothetical protein